MFLPVVDQLWRFALAAIPLALVVCALCRLLPCRPITRHTLWLTLLLTLTIAPFLPPPPVPDLVALAQYSAGPSTATGSAAPPSNTSASDRQTAQRCTSGRAGPPPPQTPLPSAIRHELHAAPATADIRSSRTASLDNHGKAESPATTPAPLFTVPESSGTEPPDAALRFDAPPASIVSIERADPSPQCDTTEAPATASPSALHPVESASTKSAANATAASPASPLPEPLRAWTAAAGSTLGQWAGGLRIARDAVMSLPPLPAPIWAAGSAFILLLLIVRLLAFRRLLRTAAPAAPETIACVQDTARALGLRRCPDVHMIPARLSPLVWCGRRPRVLLPAELWNQLDEPGREAVVCHELAHLRRRDHWVCWLSLVVGCLYWWHPVVWWIRRRLREEADLCCDVWVTSLMPSARRAYAGALLQTKRYTSSVHPFEPAVGLGVSITRTNCFARRLTMVMSHQLTPRRTLAGTALACVLAAGAWLVTPTLACSPGDDAARTPPAEKAPPSPAVAPAPPAPLAPPKLVPPRAVTLVGNPGHDSLDQRIAHLEKQLDALVRKLEKWSDSADLDLPAIDFDVDQIAELQHLPQQLQKIVQAQAGSAYDSAIGMYRNAMAGSPLAAAQAETSTRAYELPEGKLHMLIELMARDDVPVLVSPHDDHIEVHGTPEQHIIFEAFCLMIDGEDRVETYPLSGGKLQALSELMVRSDVPILVSPQNDGIRVHGTDLEQKVFKSFVNMIEPKQNATIKVVPKAGTSRDRNAAPLREKARQYELKAKAQVEELKALAQLQKSLQRQIREHEAKAEHFDQKAEQLEERLDKIEEMAEQAEHEADHLDGERRLAAVKKLNQLLLKAAEIENEIRYLQVQAEALEMQAEALQEQADEVEHRIDELKDNIANMKQKKEKDKKKKKE